METFADTEDTRLESYKKTVMPKKKVFAARTLQDCLPNLPLETGKAKKKIQVFLSRQFYASLKTRKDAHCE
jgi:hypothetical protein